MTAASGNAERLVIRPARETDVDRIAQLLYGDPSPEALAVAGSPDRARRFGLGLVHMARTPMGWPCCDVAEKDGLVVGVVQHNDEGKDLVLTPGVLLLWLRTFGPVAFLRGLPVVLARRRVSFAAPPAALWFTQLKVDARFRNQGIGAALFRHVEEGARFRGLALMALVTAIDSPARRLYERLGYRVVETRTNRSFEHRTGIPGRVLMTKELV